MSKRALLAPEIFDGTHLHRNAALLLDGAVFETITPLDAIPERYCRQHFDEGIITPGFVDLQVNGGGGVMFNDTPSVDTLERMAASHYTTGTRAFLPTLITDTPECTQTAIDAVDAAVKANVPGIIGDRKSVV